MALTPKQQLFVLEYPKDLNGTQAAIRAGYSEATARQAAAHLLSNTDIQAALAESFKARDERVNGEADEVLRDIQAIAHTDASELVQVRNTCCRFCWGIEYKYQYTTTAKLRRAESEFERDPSKSVTALVDGFQHGGVGFDPKRDPHPECPECGGQGVQEVYITDTRKLSRGALVLYAGAKRTKDGIEIKLHDKSKMLDLLARHHGLVREKIDVHVQDDITNRLAAGRKRVRQS